MRRKNWLKTILVYIPVIICLYYLIPTLLGLQEGEVASDKAEEERWWTSILPEKKLRLGLDLQGGIDLVLEVDVDKAIESSSRRNVDNIKDYAKKKGLKVEEINEMLGSSVIKVRLKEGESLERLKNFFKDEFSIYEYSGSRSEGEGDEKKIYYLFDLTDDQKSYIKERAIKQALETLRNRIDEFGVTEPTIIAKGYNRINIQLPGIKDPDRALKIISKTAHLEFRLVDEDFPQENLLRLIEEAKKQANFKEEIDEEELNKLLIGKIPEDDEVLYRKEWDATTRKMIFHEPYLVKKSSVLTGEYIEDASVAVASQFNQPYVSMELNPVGAKIFAKVTEENVGKRLAIILDRNVNSAPVIKEKIPGGRASIELGTGSYNELMEEASDLSIVLRAGALPAPVNIVENRAVGPSLGQDSIRRGKLSFIIGGLLVAIFIGFYYSLSGIIAIVSLILNALLILGILSILQATLTLPGIAGIILTIGMAVDGNILVFERIREELQIGKTPRSSIGAGYSRALVTILDSNITTFLTALVLYSYGTGPIKGFAVTLMIGIITTLYTVLLISRGLIESMVEKLHFKKIPIG